VTADTRSALRAVRRRGLPPTSPLGLARRGLRWGRAGLRLCWRTVGDRLTGRRSEKQTGIRLRQLFEEVGGTAVKLGQQLSVRADLLPPGVCEQLASLSDRVPPMDFAVARAVIAAELGRPLEQVYTHIDPEPIGSASVACVYRARLHSGETVAIKVRRPDIPRQFSEDLAAFDRVARFAEWSTFVRDGFFAHLRKDLRIMFSEEMDFVLEARYQRLFSRSVKRANMPWVTAPKVYSALSGPAVLVTGFAEGVRGAELLGKIESGDPDTDSWLEERGIDAAKLARRVLRFSLWARFEAPFFHADPHPGNLIVTADDRIVLLDFGACGTTSRRTRLNHTQVLNLMVQNDPAAITRVMLSDLSPLPHLDMDEFSTNMDKKFHRFILACEDETAHWSERIVAGIWLQMLEVARHYQIRMNLDTVRSIRAFLLYDTLAFRIDGTIGLDETTRYLKEAAARQARDLTEGATAFSRQEQEERMFARQLEFIRRTEETTKRLEPAIEGARATFQAAASQATLAARFLMRLTLLVSLTGLAVSAGRLLGWRLPAIPWASASWPVVAIVGSLVGLVLARHMLLSLGRIETR